MLADSWLKQSGGQELILLFIIIGTRAALAWRQWFIEFKMRPTEPWKLLQPTKFNMHARNAATCIRTDEPTTMYAVRILYSRRWTNKKKRNTQKVNGAPFLLRKVSHVADALCFCFSCDDLHKTNGSSGVSLTFETKQYQLFPSNRYIHPGMLGEFVCVCGTVSCERVDVCQVLRDENRTFPLLKNAKGESTRRKLQFEAITSVSLHVNASLVYVCSLFLAKTIYYARITASAT